MPPNHSPFLHVFIGKPGVGKSTLIQRIRTNERIIDVFEFVKPYKVDGFISSDGALNGYTELYEAIRRNAQDQSILLELGTNHPMVNIERLSRLQHRFDIHLFLCTASVQTSRQRVHERNPRVEDNPILHFSNEALEERLQRLFPDEYIEALSTISLPYTLLDMEQPLDRVIAEYKQHHRH